MKLATKLTAVILTFLMIIGAAITLLVYRASLDSLEAEISGEMESLAFHLMDTIDRSLYERYADIQMVASDQVISSRDSTAKQITERLIEYRNTYKTYASLSFFDLNRIRIADTAGLHLGEQHHMVRYWEDVLAGNVSAASDIRLAEELHAPVIYFASPVKDENGEAFAVVVARMPIRKLYDTTKGAEKDGFEIDLMDKAGLLLYSNYNNRGIL